MGGEQGEHERERKQKMKTAGKRGEKKESDRVIVRERGSGTVQLWDRIKQSLLCQQLNTPAERTSSIVEAASTKTPIADVKPSSVSSCVCTRICNMNWPNNRR